jgi:hypothetical protein
MKDTWNIVRVNEDWTENILTRFRTFEGALQYLTEVAKEKQWKFHKDDSLFGGYCEDADGNTYVVR